MPWENASIFPDWYISGQYRVSYDLGNLAKLVFERTKCRIGAVLLNFCTTASHTETTLKIWKSGDLEIWRSQCWSGQRARSDQLCWNSTKFWGGWDITISIGLDPFSVVRQQGNTSSWNSQWSYLWWTWLSSWSCSTYLQYKCSGVKTNSFLIHIKFNLLQPESSPLPPPRTTIIIVMLMSRCKRPLDLKALVETLYNFTLFFSTKKNHH